MTGETLPHTPMPRDDWQAGYARAMEDVLMWLRQAKRDGAPVDLHIYLRVIQWAVAVVGDD